MDTAKTSGMSCPQCGGYIPLSLEELLTGRSITCPHCDLQLTINRKATRQVLDKLNANRSESRKKTDA